MAIDTPEPVLVLWDIDHTLIETRGVGSMLYRQAFQAVTGQAIEHHVEITGRTELAILAETLRRHDIEISDDLVRRYADELARLYEEHAGLLGAQGRALPGAREALAALVEVPGLVQSVLTGNLRQVAAVKLRVFDLDRFVDLDVGAYGEDDLERANLVGLCQQRAGRKYGTPFTRHNSVIIGDSVGDVVTARQGGARIIAVASGRHSVEEMREAGAECVVENLVDTGRMVEAITNNPDSA